MTDEDPEVVHVHGYALDLERLTYATIVVMSVLAVYTGWAKLSFLSATAVVVAPVLALGVAHAFSEALHEHAENRRPLNGREWKDVELVAACDVDVPLLGLQGASAGFAPQKGASVQQAQQLEAALAQLSRHIGAVLGAVEHPDLLSGEPGAARLAAVPGAGAAGGLGFGLAALGARLVGGAALVADEVGLADRIAAADVVVTGEGRFD